MPKKKKAVPKPLTGDELLTKVKLLKQTTREEKAKACGYYNTSRNGTERTNVMAFLNAILEAEGLNLDAKSGRNSNNNRGRRASYKTTVQGNGNLLVGDVYTKQMELQAGDELQLSLGRKHIHLTLIKEKD